MRHQKAYCVCRQIHAQTAASHHAVPIGVCASAPDVRQGALGGRRARLDGVNSCFGSGKPSFASLGKVATVRPRPGFFCPQWVHPDLIAQVLIHPRASEKKYDSAFGSRCRKSHGRDARDRDDAPPATAPAGSASKKRSRMIFLKSDKSFFFFRKFIFDGGQAPSDHKST